MVYKQIDRHAKDLRGTKAIIIGGGIAGKLFAAAISPYFHRIHILEKDVEPLEKRVGEVFLRHTIHMHFFRLEKKQWKHYFLDFERIWKLQVPLK
ncbi:hypothetical protein RCG23_23900 [Neobacillus sp. PS3-34]|uniref:hypothetical protein n=1 Tax=Neobacillus sp. PS3-34 TaxID=3070678 RepID=UPI0027E2176B|nr:hypothetical protein [Neobacillus sp. PS3-34]WML48257.1 hypothetical protein RCG23_23900 [Neobacillus sp. PS3-34]